jgi:hypothetical protein
MGSLNPVVALNSAPGFIKPLPREEWLLNQCRPLDQSKSDFWKVSTLRAMRPSLRGRSPSGAEPGPAAKGWKQPFYGGMQLIQPHLYATTG